MIADTNGVDCMIVRENEIGIYDTARVTAIYSCNGFIRLVDGSEFRLTNKEKLIERIKK